MIMRRLQVLLIALMAMLPLANLQAFVSSPVPSSIGETVNLPISQIKQYQAESNKGSLRPWCDCGPASIAMILRYYGFRPSLKDSELVELARVKTGNTRDCPSGGYNVPAAANTTA